MGLLALAPVWIAARPTLTRFTFRMAMISKIFRTVAPVVAGIVSLSLVTPASLAAQSAISPVANRLTQPVDESSRVTLKGTVHPFANAANDRGAAPDSIPLDRLQIVLQRSAVQESALQQLIHDEHTPGTASYHKWLTPAQFGQQFGPSDQDVATLSSWLESKGFNVKGVNPGKQTLEISGNVAQFRSAFRSQIHKYTVNGETHYANATDPQVPAALAPVFGGFVSLNNFRPHRMSHVLGQATYDPKTDKATPQWTYGTGNQVQFVLAPGDFGVQYDLPPASSGNDGTGQTIAIINDSNINIDLVNQFRTLFNLPANPPQVIISGNDPGVDGINDPDGPNGDSNEAYLDVEWSGAVAPKATIDLVIGADTALETGLFLAAEDAVYNNLAPVMSVSFGVGCEANLGNSNQFLNALWEQAAAQGITVMVSTGDSGSAGCDDTGSPYYAVGGAAVSGLASTPWNVAVGGTDFFYSDYATGGASISNYWNTTASPTPSTSIKGVIPEQPWNDSQYGLNIFSVYSANNPVTSIAGAGGGASTVYPKPAWQSGTGVPADSHRDIPDVSLFAANGLNASFYPICYADGDCQPASGTNLIQITGIGGTSASSPAFAGIMALVNQKYGRQGQANFILYPLAKQFPAAFHDVTHGNNSVPCNITNAGGIAPLDCITVSNPLTVTDPTFGTATEGQIGTGTTPDFNATAGFDLASGLGTVDANVLISDWGSVQLTSSTVSLTSPSAGASFTHGQSVTFTGTVAASGGSPTPTGNVAIETDSTESGQQGQGFPGLFQNAASSSTFALSSGSFNGSLTTLPGGTYNVWASYSGDGTNAAALSGKTQITVSSESSGIYLAVDDVATGRNSSGPALTSGATVPYGAQLILSAEVTPSSELTAFTNCQTGTTACPPPFTIPTGTVAFSDGATAINTAVINSEGDAEFNAPFGVGSHSVTANYSGDSSYKSSTSSAITFTVAQETPTMSIFESLQTQSGALIGGQQNVLTIQLENTVNNANEATFRVGYSNPIAAPTGTVTITGLPGGTQTATLAAGVDPQNLDVVAIGTITLPSTAAAGNYSVTVSYPGDANYTAVSGSQTITIQNVGGVASTTTASISGSISPTTTLTISGTVTGKAGDPAPTNANGGVEIYSSGFALTVPLTTGTGDSSTFSATFDSRGLLQGTNAITVQFLGDNTYAPSAITLTPAISNPLSDFSMVPNATIVPVTVGTAATDTIQLAPVNGFSNSVSFTCTASSGITCSLNPTSYTFSGGASTSTLTLNASTSAINGANNILITGVDSTGKYVHTLSIQADVAGATAPVAGFTLNASPAALTFAPGATTGNTAGLSVTPSNGFTGDVALTASVTGPSGATSLPTVSFSPTPLDITGQGAISSILTFATTSSTTTGSYTVTVTGTSGSITETATFNLTIGVLAAPNFALASGGAITISSPGATTGNTTSISVTPSGGFTGAVNFTCAVTTSPSGATDSPTCSAPAANVTGTGAVSSTLTVSTTAGTTAAVHHPLDKFFAAGGGIVVAGLFLFGIPARRRNWRSILAILLFAGLVGVGIGCGGSSHNNGGGGTTTGGTTTGAYVLTVTGTDAATGKITATTTVNVTVN